MKSKFALIPLALALAIGCSPGEPTPSASNSGQPTSDSATAETSTGETLTFVSLKVPNMVWGSCAASVRGDLTKIPTATEIVTSIPNRSATFKVSPEVDYASELATYAESNTHLAGYSIE